MASAVSTTTLQCKILNRRKKTLFMQKKGIPPLRYRRRIDHLLVRLSLPSIESIQEEILFIQQQIQKEQREHVVVGCNVKRVILNLGPSAIHTTSTATVNTTTTTTTITRTYLESMYSTDAVPAEILEDNNSTSLQQQHHSRHAEPKIQLQGDDAVHIYGQKSQPSQTVRMSTEEKHAFLKHRYGMMKSVHRQQRLKYKVNSSGS
jgi:hypothetical protein